MTPAPRISPERCQRIKGAIEAALRAGFDPVGAPPCGRGSAITEAVRALCEQGHKETRFRLYRFIKAEAKNKARGDLDFLPDWSLFSAPGVPASALRKGQVRRWILTAAQDDTDIHPRFWSNLQAFATYLGAELHVAGFTYQQIRHSDRMTLSASYRAEVRPFLRFDPLDCGPVLFCAEMNTLPTAARPLSGLAAYSRGRDAVFPHAKIAYETVPQMPGAHVPSIMTTGAVTVPNYIAKKAGLKAEFHHILGATLVEVDGSGAAWCRQISATADGSFQDLDRTVRGGKISTGNRIKAATFGDIHLPSVGEDVFAALWGPSAGSLVEALRPEYAFFQDLLSFEQASRHVDNDPLHRAKMVHRGHSGMEAHVRAGTSFLRATARDFCRSVMVESNHDDRLLQWARRDADRRDVENVAYWHRCNLAALEASAAGLDGFNLLRWALKEADPRRLEGIDFIPMGGSFVICQDSGGIECGMHGHQGPNGSRGSAVGLSRMATRITIGDKHSPQIADGVYVAGMTGDLDQGYNTGPTSWRRAHVLAYPNGKRTIITQAPDGRWRA
jgi:hypothetical protein